MRTHFLIALFFLFFAVAVSAQTERSLSAFDEINVTGNIEVILEKGDAEKIFIQAEGIPEDELKVKVDSEVLKLSLINSVFYKNEKVTVRVVFQQIRAIRGNAGANIRSNVPIEGDQLLLRANSGAQLKLTVKAKKLDGAANEGAILTLAGEVEAQKVSATTGGQYEALDLECQRTYARANTGGVASVVARESIDASANTGGSITYKGDPEQHYSKTILGGDVRKL